VRLCGQVEPDADKGKASLWAGAEFANYRAGFPHGSGLRLSGVGAFVTFNRTHHIGFEGHVRFLYVNSWNGETEQDYLAGPRYTFFMSNRWRPFADLEVGAVRIHYPFHIGTGDQFAIAPGGGLEYRVSHRVSVRGIYEYQILPNSPNFTDEPHFGVHPNGVYGGLSIRPF
jgi:opacity protein-like surface antigen